MKSSNCLNFFGHWTLYEWFTIQSSVYKEFGEVPKAMIYYAHTEEGLDGCPNKDQGVADASSRLFINFLLGACYLIRVLSEISEKTAKNLRRSVSGRPKSRVGKSHSGQENHRNHEPGAIQRIL